MEMRKKKYSWIDKLIIRKHEKNMYKLRKQVKFLRKLLFCQGR